MSTIVILSSSPPRDIARSPTPADLSSPELPLASAILREESPGRRRFKTLATKRDGFPGAFSTARQVLAAKEGAVNQIISPTKNKFRSSQKSEGELDVQNDKVERSVGVSWHAGRELKDPFTSNIPDPVVPAIVQIQASDARRRKTRKTSPLLLQKATTRRLDWTPPKLTAGPSATNDLDLGQGSISDDGRFASFSYHDEARIVQVSETEIQPTKRRKLDSVGATAKKTSKVSVANGSKKAATKTPAKRSKSPTKKSLTITGLSTSKFHALETTEPTPMMQYLASTQAEMRRDAQDDPMLQSKVETTKMAVKKLRVSTKSRAKSLLVSPSSAMKSFEDQETIFGSASQLIRDESPSFLRDTIEATKQSEASFSNTFSSPQRTQAYSIESNTPSAATSKFRRSRNLWAAACRDEDNALLHIDTIDLTDTPTMRNAFAGKDVMVQPGARTLSVDQQRAPTAGSVSMLSPLLTDTVDVDRIVPRASTPNLQRSFCTSARATSPRKTGVPDPVEKHEIATGSGTVRKPASKVSKVTKKRPHYAGFTDLQLKKQITAFGFKAVKKREKMIELLDKCWDEKHGSSEIVAEVEPETEKSAYGDFLSNVHDVLARPVPKTKKPRAKRKSSDPKPTTAAVKKPRQSRKKQVDEESSEKATKEPSKKTTRKRKPKTVALSEAIVHDIDDVDESSKPLPASTVSKVTPTTSVVNVDEQTLATGLATPSASTSSPKPAVLPSSEPKSALDIPQLTTPQPSTATTTTSTSSQPELQDQITRAVFHESSTSRLSVPDQPKRNHQTNPTWHEKILLYDPIVLEELAAWLNTRGFKSIDEDREVSAYEVRSWCESRGICCLWKGGWRGNRGGGGAD